MPRGRPKTVIPGENIRLYREHSKDIAPNGKLASSNSKIFIDLGKKLNKISKSVYLVVQRDFSEIFPEYSSQTNTSHREEERSIHSDESVEDTESQDRQSVIKFQIVIDPSVFPLESYLKKVRKHQYVCNRLKSGWADKLFDLIWREKKSVLCFDIQNRICTIDVNGSILFKGMCAECGALFVGNTNCSHTILTVDITNYKAYYVHFKRRHLKGATRENPAAR